MLEVFAIAALVVIVLVLFVGFMLLGVAALSAEDADGRGLHSAQPVGQGAAQGSGPEPPVMPPGRG